MGKEKRVLKWIQSYLERIDEHFDKFDDAYQKGDKWLLKHYIKEIDFSFFGNIQKVSSKLRISSQLEQHILDRKKKRDERKNLPLN